MRKTVIIVMAFAALQFFGAELRAKTAVDSELLIYEYNLKGPMTMESEIIKTNGTIKSIIASWDFEGEARLAVSANGGVSYANIINGQPLSEGFIAGNELRFRADIGAGSILKKLVLGYSDTSGKVKIYQNPDLAGFKYHKVIRVSGSGEEFFNYPIKIKLPLEIFANGRARDDLGDVRFTAADGQAPLSYYLEEKSAISADFWVKVPQLPKEGARICLYYGNAEAKDASGGKEVFSFFDDFSAAALDRERWLERSELKGECLFEGGYLKIKDSALITRDFKMKKGILEFKARADKDCAIQALMRGHRDAHSGAAAEQVVYSSAYPGAEHTIAVNDIVKLNMGSPIAPDTDYIYKVGVNTSGIIFERYSDNYEKQAEIRFLDVGGADEGYIGLKAAGAPFGGGSVYFDWVRVRPYTEIEPEITARLIADN